MTNPYFDELTRRLRGRGLPEKEITRTVADLAAFAAESGTDPEQEFGTPDEFAAQLAGAGEPGSAPAGAAAPPASAETWTWRADAFHEREVLNRYGDEGWEVERVDSVGRFVSRRTGDHPLRWEYRRETALPRNRAAVAERLAPDGWEPCGSWFHFEYFKRPKAVMLGLEGELDLPPEAPAQATYWSRRFYLFLAGYIALIAAVCTAWIVFALDDSRSTFIGGFLAGGVVAVALVGLRLWQAHRAH
ncbi:hypothetical protein HUT06_07450 [Actinomadura sp. NAK00032]|uniref:hypothetical protein n=1 Tax=Actinomadura sp. NAK00032 TaxID=2742128 RepID=UPI0015918F66|nr:hypothetical protein [Actinomadura sp. NAK00032]QKW33885.1 hypothetical protein HUT06_07450 [Actinomadura sp. NAK00032]